MPLRKPHKGESQSDWMKYCMHEMGTSETDRPQDQQVAICMSAWRDAHPSAPGPKKAAAPEPTRDESYDAFMARCKKTSDEHSCETKWNEHARAGEKDPGKWDPHSEHSMSGARQKADDKDGKDKKPYGDVEYADPGYQKDKRKRYPLDTEDHIRAAWSYINMPKNQEPYTSEQVASIKAKIVAAWKKKIDSAGPPSAEDKKAWEYGPRGMSKDEIAARQADFLDVSDPGDDEDEDDYIERCVDELQGQDDDLDDDHAEQICRTKWEESKSVRAKPREPVFHKTHSGTVQNLEFIMSDDSVDRMGDVIMSDGWDISNFRNNPICLFNHTPSFVIGKWNDLRVEKGALRGHLQMAPEGTSEIGRAHV